MRRPLAVLVAAGALVVMVAPPAQAKDPVKDREAAQSRANAAAGRFARATRDLARVEDELRGLEARTAAHHERLSALEGRVKAVAVNSYVRGGAAAPFVFDPDLSRTARQQAMARWVHLGDTDVLDDYRAVRQDLEVGSSAVKQRIAERRQAASALDKQKASAYSELSRLAEAERRYLARVAAEKAKQAAEKAKQSAARQAAARRPSRSEAGPAGPAEAGRASGVIATGAWVCPVQGPRSFSNDYGDPRSGGRRHQGNDILAPRGTPVVASVSGTVAHHNSSLGGLSYFLKGSDGTTYFGTHLQRFGAAGSVAAGTVIGYVGDSGNARGTPHLHFEMHPGGRGPVNPFTTLSRFC